MNVKDLIPMALRPCALDKITHLSQTEVLEPYLTQQLTQNGAILNVSITATTLLNSEGHLYAIATTERLNIGA